MGVFFNQQASLAFHSSPVTTMSVVYNKMEYKWPAVNDYNEVNMYNKNGIIVSES